jgi:hypothetical protein
MLSALRSLTFSVLFGSGLGLMLLSLSATAALAHGWHLGGWTVFAFPLPFAPLGAVVLLGLASMAAE